MDSPADNAAPGYRKAFSLLPQLTQSEVLLVDYMATTTPLDERAFAIVAKAEPAIQEWKQAASLPYCDWNAPLTPEGFEQLQALWDQANRLNHLICVGIRVLFSRGQIHEARDLVALSLRTARHVGGENLYMSRLTQGAIELNVVRVAAAHLHTLDEPDLGWLLSEFHRLPHVADFKQVARREKLFAETQGEGYVRKMTLTEHTQSLRMFLQAWEVDEILKAANHDMSKLLEMDRQLLPHYDTISEIIMLPLEEFQPALAAIAKAHRKENPTIIELIRQVEVIHYAELRNRINLAQFRAALAILLHDEGELEKAIDPYTGEPFKPRFFKGGFELRSSLWGVGQERLVLTVGQERGLVAAIRGAFRVLASRYAKPTWTRIVIQYLG